MTPMKMPLADECEGSRKESEEEEELDENVPEVSPVSWRKLVLGARPSTNLNVVEFDPSMPGGFDAANRSTGLTLFTLALEAMEANSDNAGVILVNLFRQLLHQGRALASLCEPSVFPERPQGTSFESEIVGVMDALLPGVPLKSTIVAGAVEDAFNLKLGPGENIADAALSGRKKQQTLKLKGALTLAEVRTVRQNAEKVTSVEDVRKSGLTGLLASSQAQNRETMWLVRLLLGKVRCGRVSVLRALAFACVLNRPARWAPTVALMSSPLDDLIVQMESLSQLVILGYGRAGGMEPIIRALLNPNCSLESVGRACVAAVGVPILPMYASASLSKRKVMTSVTSSPMTAEWCYHGERIQLHVQNGEVKAFGSDQQELTELLGLRLTASLREALRGQSTELIIDAVIQGIDRAKVIGDKGNTSVRTHDILDQLAGLPQDTVDPEIAALEAKLKALKKLKRETMTNGGPRLIIFDLLWKDGDLLTGYCLKVRRKQLHAIFKDNPPLFTLAMCRDFKAYPDTQCLATMLTDAVASGLATGLVLKRLNASYEAGRRSGAWQILRQHRANIVKQ